MQKIESSGVPILAWTDGVELEVEAREQLRNVARMPFVGPHVAVMPDVHWGIGATVGSVIATTGAIIPAAVGVDIGCGMVAARLNLIANDLPDSLAEMRSNIEQAVPHGRTANGGAGDKGAWELSRIPLVVGAEWANISPDFHALAREGGVVADLEAKAINQLGTLGGGNHFVELCVDESQGVWLMLHSGSRGIGNRIGTHYISLAKEEMLRNDRRLPDKDLAYLEEGTESFARYVRAVSWAQRYAYANRAVMLMNAARAVGNTLGRVVEPDRLAVNCHHNYVSLERHFGEDRWVTRKGAVSAQPGELGIIPGSMGAKSFIVRGKGNADSFHSCSHGAGRRMSRGKAKKTFTVEDHERATAGVECRKDASVLDETPGAYKDIDAVMAAQADLVEVVHTLKQVLCVKG